MDRKALLAIVACLALLGLLNFVIVPKFFPPVPRPPGATNVVAAPQPGAATNPSVPATTVMPGTTPTGTPRFGTASNVAEQTITVTNENARYTFTSHGGGLKLVELLNYREVVSRRTRKLPITNGVATLNTHAPAPVLAVLGDDNITGDGIFELTPIPTGVRAEKTLTNGLRIIKDFQVSTNYLVSATVRMENTSSAQLVLPAQEWVIGTATPMGPDDKGDNVGLMWYDGGKKQEILSAWFQNRGFMCTAGVPRPEYRAGTSNVVWVSAHNQFFTLTAMPQERALQVISRVTELPRANLEDIPPNLRDAPPPKGFVTSLAYPGVMLSPGQALERKINFFTGPKEYQTLARIAERFHNNVDLVMGFSGFFGFFSKALLLSMNWLHHSLLIPYGWAIIVITVIIKALFWPLTQASTRSMKRLAALQPQMNAIKEKYKDDPVKMNKKVMEFMKENKVSPLGGCLPMLLQMPVFIGFFYMIRTAIELRGASFLWVGDLSKPDTLFFIPGTSIPFNFLPLLMGATMLWQSHLTPPSPGMDPMQQKMMRYMPLMILVFLYNYSAGLALYWTVQNLLSILQTKLIKSSQPLAVVPATSPALTPQSKKKK